MMTILTDMFEPRGEHPETCSNVAGGTQIHSWTSGVAPGNILEPLGRHPNTFLSFSGSTKKHLQSFKKHVETFMEFLGNTQRHLRTSREMPKNMFEQSRETLRTYRTRSPAQHEWHMSVLTVHVRHGTDHTCIPRKTICFCSCSTSIRDTSENTPKSTQIIPRQPPESIRQLPTPPRQPSRQPPETPPKPPDPTPEIHQKTTRRHPDQIVLEAGLRIKNIVPVFKTIILADPIITSVPTDPRR